MSEPITPAGLDPGHELPAPGDAAVTDASEELRLAREERDQFRDRWMRAAAEMDNFRKRTQREAGDQALTAAAEVVRAVLPVLDGLERAQAHPEAPVADLRKGLELLQRQLSEGLRRIGVEPVEAAQAVFDPRLHEAVETIETTAAPENTVVEQLQRGYRLRDRLLRPAMVKVARAPHA